VRGCPEGQKKPFPGGYDWETEAMLQKAMEILEEAGVAHRGPPTE